VAVRSGADLLTDRDFIALTICLRISGAFLQDETLIVVEREKKCVGLMSEFRSWRPNRSATT